MADCILDNGVNILYSESMLTDIADAVGKIAAAGKVALIGSGGRLTEDAADKLMKEGYALTKYILDDSSILNYHSVYDKEIEENAVIIIGIGSIGAIEGAKLLSAKSHVKCLLIPTDFTAMCALKEGVEYYDGTGLFFVPGGSPQTVLLDKTLLKAQKGETLAQGLGYVLMRLVGVFDAIYQNIVLRNDRDNTAGTAILEQAFAELSDISERKQPELAEELLEVAIKIERGIAESGIEVCGSADTLSHIISLYKKAKLPYNEYAFISAYGILQLYNSYLADVPLERILPPDRDNSFSMLQELCGVTYADNLVRSRTEYALDYHRRYYVTADYSADLLHMISNNKIKLSSMCRVYRRLQGSAGYYMSQVIGTDELLRLISLSGEESTGYPLIKHIKLTGILESLL